MLFVVYTSRLGTPVNPWPLTLDGYATKEDAEQAIRWQCVGGSVQPSDMHVCRRMGQAIFVSLRTGDTIEVDEASCFTPEAWRTFLASWRATA